MSPSLDCEFTGTRTVFYTLIPADPIIYAEQCRCSVKSVGNNKYIKEQVNIHFSLISEMKSIKTEKT